MPWNIFTIIISSFRRQGSKNSSDVTDKACTRKAFELLTPGTCLPNICIYECVCHEC